MGTWGQTLESLTASDLLKAVDSKQQTMKPTEAEQQFGGDYYATEPIVPSNVAIERGYDLGGNPPPEPESCEYCGATLYYNGLIATWKSNPSVFRWGEEPQRCECEAAAAKWEKHDVEVEREKAERKRIADEERHRKRVESAIGASGIKSRFLTRTFANFVTDTPERQAAYNAAESYSGNFGKHLEAGEGIYIEGTFGTGKTHLAAAIALSLIERDYSVILKTADDLFRDIKRTFDGDDTGAEHKLLDNYKTCDLLIIDDLGKEQATDWTTAMLYAIVNDRYERLMPTIVTTNFNENDLIALESPRGIGEHRIRAILSRLHETTATLTMAWKEDWRNR